MKGLSVCAILIFSVVAFVSRDTTSKQIKSKSVRERAGIFSEVEEGELVPKGYAHLIIKAHIRSQGISLTPPSEKGSSHRHQQYG